MSEVTLLPADNGKSITVGLGEKIVLRLNENPTTGFRWAVDIGGQDIIELRSSDYVRSPDSAIGGGGQRVFVFEAKKGGDLHLLLKLRREWEGDRSVASTFNVYIHVSN